MPPPQMLSIGNPSGDDPIPFPFAGTSQSNQPGFLVVSPSSGVTPALLRVGLDWNVAPYMASGACSVGLWFAPPGIGGQISAFEPFRVAVWVSPRQPPAFSAPGLREPGAHNWTYQYVFAGEKAPY